MKTLSENGSKVSCCFCSIKHTNELGDFAFKPNSYFPRSYMNIFHEPL